jgi:hypothetical protein
VLLLLQLLLFFAVLDHTWLRATGLPQIVELANPFAKPWALYRLLSLKQFAASGDQGTLKPMCWIVVIVFIILYICVLSFSSNSRSPSSQAAHVVTVRLRTCRCKSAVQADRKFSNWRWLRDAQVHKLWSNVPSQNPSPVRIVQLQDLQNPFF